jgi:hypothetical protein
MTKLDQRGTVALEFCLVAGALFSLMFAIFDLGRYALTVQSLGSLAGAGARAIMINECYFDNIRKKQEPSGCPTDPLTRDAKEQAAPFLFAGGLTPQLLATEGASPITVRASQPQFAMIMPFWPASFTAPSVTTKIPYSVPGT